MSDASPMDLPAMDLPAMDRPAKRSLAVGGHATSISLEEAFWQGLRAMAAAEGLTLAALVTEIDRRRPPAVGLATAIRLTVLDRASRAGRAA